MPKPPGRYKKFPSSMSSRAANPGRKPFIVKDLLAKSGLLSKVSAQLVDSDQQWREFFRKRLPEDMAGQIDTLVEEAGTLTVFASSAAWSARLKYALLELEPEMKRESARLKRCVVKVARN
jgi:hypothetical protein